MNDVNETLSDIKKVIELIPDDENKFELEQLMLQLEKEINIQNQFIEGIVDYLNNVGMLKEAKEHAIIYTKNDLYSKSQQEKKYLESRGIKPLCAYTYPYELEWFFENIEFHLELLKDA